MVKKFIVPRSESIDGFPSDEIFPVSPLLQEVIGGRIVILLLITDRVGRGKNLRVYGHKIQGRENARLSLVNEEMEVDEIPEESRKDIEQRLERRWRLPVEFHTYE